MSQQPEAAAGRAVCIVLASGCPRAEVDTALLFGYFDANGWTHTTSVAQADVTVVTTCGVDLEHENMSYRSLDAIDRQRKPGSTMVVVGCAAGIIQADLDKRYDAVVVAPRDAQSLDGIINATVSLNDIGDPSPIAPLLTRAKSAMEQLDLRAGQKTFKRWTHAALAESGVRKSLARLGRASSADPSTTSPDTWTLRVARGCKGECSFCAIRAACGPLRSKPLATVMSEFERGRTAGFTEFRLVAQDLGAYGVDIGSTVIELLTALLGEPGNSRFSVVDIGANWFLEYSDELIGIFSEHSTRIQRLVVPIQSGSDKILGLMKRGHTASEALETFRAARMALPHVEFSTHAMVGFPGETEEDFQDTVRFLRAVGFDRVDVWDYTDRPGTPASTMPDKVDPKILRSRSQRIRTEFHGRTAGLEYRARSWFAPRA